MPITKRFKWKKYWIMVSKLLLSMKFWGSSWLCSLIKSIRIFYNNSFLSFSFSEDTLTPTAQKNQEAKTTQNRFQE